MSSFSRRMGIRSEFSGPGEIPPALRTRLKQACVPYVARGYIGIGQEGRWMRGEDLDSRLIMEFGREVKFADIILSGRWDEVLNAIEIYCSVAASAFERHHQIRAEINAAFQLSGSVYYLDIEGRIALKMERDAAAKVERASKVLTPSAEAKRVFDGAVSGLLSRRRPPQDVVKDTLIAFEEFLKQVTSGKDFDDAVSALRNRGTLTSTQAALLQKLYGYRSAGFGATHAGAERTPTEADALWFVETVAAQLNFLGNVIRLGDSPVVSGV